MINLIGICAVRWEKELCGIFRLWEMRLGFYKYSLSWFSWLQIENSVFAHVGDIISVSWLRDTVVGIRWNDIWCRDPVDNSPDFLYPDTSGRLSSVTESRTCLWLVSVSWCGNPSDVLCTSCVYFNIHNRVHQRSTDELARCLFPIMKAFLFLFPWRIQKRSMH